jgi:putative ABC transport system permease protein
VARRIPIAWLQLGREPLRLLVGAAGVAFAVMLVFMQLGFRAAMYESATRYHRSLDYDLVLISPKTPFVGIPEGFTRRRLYQALAADGVAAIAGVYIQQAFWKNPWARNVRNIVVVGIDPTRQSFLLADVQRQIDAIRLPDVVLFDARSRREFGPVADRIAAGASVSAEVNDRRVSVGGLFVLGTSFGIDGTLVTSDLNFRRVFPTRAPGEIDLGLVQLVPGADPRRVRAALERALERDVLVLTRAEFVAREVEYWGRTTPIGYVFGFGATMGLIVGAVIVYQILFADVSQHRREYATLKAMGYSNRFLSGVVLQEAAILALLGYAPGLLATFGLYRVTAEATRLPLELHAGRVVGVLALTLAMCGGAALVALRKVRSADPAEVFA